MTTSDSEPVSSAGYPHPGESAPSSESAPPESAAPPDRVGPYRVGVRIGRGGMGSVHEAIEIATGRRVALKLVKEGASDRACARLLREARTARTAAGAHVVEVLGAGLDEGGRPYVAMEMLDGEDLASWLRREGRLDVDEALDLVDELLEGLERVHAAGVVHRDLKPENLVIVGQLRRSEAGRPDAGRSDAGASDASDAAPVKRGPRMKIVDFGVSKVRSQGVLVPGSLTREGIVLGTPLYMSPEQAQGLADVDERSDLWSAGAIAYQCLTGRAPFAGGTYEQIVVAICSTDADDVRTRNPAVPEAVSAVLRRALARERHRRFQDARSMRLALSRARAGDIDAAGLDASTIAGAPFFGAPAPGVVTPPSQPTEAIPLVRPRRRDRRSRALAAFGVSLALGVLIAVAAGSAIRIHLRTDDAAREAGVQAAPPAPTTTPAPVAVREEEAPAPAVTPSAATSAKAPRTTPASTPVSAPRKRGIGSGLELKER